MSSNEIKFGSLRERIAFEKAERAKLRAKFAQDMEAAWIHADAVARAMQPTPMVVHNPATGAVHVVPDGVCGFAHVTIRPRTCKLARFAIEELGWRSNSWHKRAELSIQEFGQSLARKEKLAEEFAKKMNELGHSEVSWDSRID
jgi:hypothetical protein